AGGPVIVTVGFWILSIDKIDVVNMDFTIDILLRQEWIDRRLCHRLNQTITLNGGARKTKIWIPDSYFLNAKAAKMHKVTAPNVMFTIDPSGNIKYNARVTTKAACQFDLRKFPIDIQVCPLILESYGYDSQHIRYKWEVWEASGKKSSSSDIRATSNYVLKKTEFFSNMNQYFAGNFSGVRAEFTFERSCSYFLIEMYGMSVVLVAISWMGFLVPLDQTAARIALGITSVLTEVAILNIMNNAMPKVSYIKSSDKYLIGCFVFVFFTLMEYCFVLLLKARQKNHKASETFKEQTNYRENTLFQIDKRNEMAAIENESKCQPLTSPSASTDNSEPVPPEANTGKQLTWMEKYLLNTREMILGEDFMSNVDGYSFKIFPVAFALYNLYYWMELSW
ncbi:unnamed protein product, partial [Porites lobata]